MIRSLFLLAVLSGCTKTTQVVCPAVVDWPAAFQMSLGEELTAHPKSELPATHELLLLAYRQRAIVKACGHGG